MKPTTGRIVHYVSYGTPGGEYDSVCRAAVIAEVLTTKGAQLFNTCSLVVFNPTGLFFNDCEQDEADVASPGYPGHRGGTWHWPERESVPVAAAPSERVPMTSQDPLENPVATLTRDFTKEGPHA